MQITVITLGVESVKLAGEFYRDLFGWEISTASNEHITFMKSPAVILALYPRHLLAEDATVAEKGSGFRGVTIAHNVREKGDVAKIIEKACELGAKKMKPAQDVFWGGHSGYFADLDGHLWEIAWNPHFTFKKDGSLNLP